jgi:hypothetical protein
MKRAQLSNKDPSPFDPATQSTAPLPEPDLGPTAKATVAKGRSVHVPTGNKVFVKYAQQRVDQNGIVVGADVPVTRQEIRTALPGEVVTLPLTEIERLTQLGFLVDDKPARRGNGKVAVDPETGIKNDPRLTTNR